MNISKQSNLVLVLMLCVVVGTVASVSRGKSSAETQDVSGLDRRISLLEQRFYQVESSINRLQQYVASQRPQVTQPSTSDRDVIAIRDEVQRLSLRLGEVECGLVKLDERTASRRNNNTRKSDDPCRESVDTPVRLSARP
jgi:predicted RNase H-like nuclease (RuvC/YqgF family)